MGRKSHQIAPKRGKVSKLVQPMGIPDKSPVGAFKGVLAVMSVICFHNCHLPCLPFLLIQKIAIQLFDKFLQFRGAVGDLLFGVIQAVVKDIVEDFGADLRLAA